MNAEYPNVSFCVWFILPTAQQLSCTIYSEFNVKSAAAPDNVNQPGDSIRTSHLWLQCFQYGHSHLYTSSISTQNTNRWTVCAFREIETVSTWSCPSECFSTKATKIGHPLQWEQEPTCNLCKHCQKRWTWSCLYKAIVNAKGFGLCPEVTFCLALWFCWQSLQPFCYVDGALSVVHIDLQDPAAAKWGQNSSTLFSASFAWQQCFSFAFCFWWSVLAPWPPFLFHSAEPNWTLLCRFQTLSVFAAFSADR